MLFAPLELNPFEKWNNISQRLWIERYRQSNEGLYLRWIGEMEIFRHEGGLQAYNRYRELLRKNEHTD